MPAANVAAEMTSEEVMCGRRMSTGRVASGGRAEGRRAVAGEAGVAMTKPCFLERLILTLRPYTPLGRVDRRCGWNGHTSSSKNIKI